MIVIFMEFIDQLIKYPINHASISLFTMADIWTCFSVPTNSSNSSRKQILGIF